MARRDLWTVDYVSVNARGGRVRHVAVVRALTRADAVAAVRRLEQGRRDRSITCVSVLPGDDGLFAQGYARSRVVDANARAYVSTRTRIR